VATANSKPDAAIGHLERGIGELVGDQWSPRRAGYLIYAGEPERAACTDTAHGTSNPAAIMLTARPAVEGTPNKMICAPNCLAGASAGRSH
jgi:hypothetical protein